MLNEVTQSAIAQLLLQQSIVLITLIILLYSCSSVVYCFHSSVSFHCSFILYTLLIHHIHCCSQTVSLFSFSFLIFSFLFFFFFFV
ncbi:hypothetical protein I7I50_10596 [Histoplasma capsulatum G186AR]|nr:hypothetical protein I7I50_10596 [Histoplasma capsulatum G186AR]